MQLSKYKIIVVFITIFALLSCGNKNIKREISFYHWKTSLDYNDTKKDFIQSVGLSKLYVRVFDVKWVDAEKEAYPFATLQNKRSIYNDTSFLVVPTVFITNEVIKKTSEDKIKKLADNIADKIQRLCSNRFYTQTNNYLIKEIQIDCDWTEKTKKKYFTLLQEIKKSDHMGKLKFPTMSATIRLHQVKYFDKTGIPPVDRGMLMFYNMGDLQNIETENSILDLEVTKKYLDYLNDYPLPCDAALPLFSWAVVFRDGRIVKLVNNITTNKLKEHNKFKQIESNRFKVIENNYINKQFVYKDDEFRVEEVSIEKLQNLMELIVDNANNKKFGLCFYHLDDNIIENFSASDIKKIAKK